MSPSYQFNGRCRQEGLMRFNELIKLYEQVLAEGHETVIRGDLNINRLRENNPMDCYDIKLLIPRLEDFLEENRVAQLNFKATRHQTGQRSTLLDLWLSNCPEKCTEMKNIVNISSQHEGVKLILKIKGAIVKKQFAVVRSFKRLNASNILYELEKIGNFDDEMESNDPEIIADGVKAKLNQVIEKLAPRKRIQLKKENDIESKDAKDAFEKARKLKKKSIENLP